MEFTPDNKARFDRILARYPVKRSALLPAAAPHPGAGRLHLVAGDGVRGVAARAHAGAGARHRQLLHDVPVQARGAAPHRGVHQHSPAPSTAPTSVDREAVRPPRHRRRARPPPTASSPCTASSAWPPAAARSAVQVDGELGRERDRRRHGRRSSPASSSTGPSPGRRARARRSCCGTSTSRTRPRIDVYKQGGGYAKLKEFLQWKPGRHHRHGEEVEPARPRRGRLPGRDEVELPAQERQAALPLRQRRRGRAGHLQGPPPHGERSPPAHRGLHRLVLRHQLQDLLHLHPRRVPRGQPRAGEGDRRRPTPPATWARTSSAPASTSTSTCTAARAPTSAARRRRSSRAWRASAASRGVKPPFPAVSGLYDCPTAVNNVETHLLRAPHPRARRRSGSRPTASRRTAGPSSTASAGT